MLIKCSGRKIWELLTQQSPFGCCFDMNQKIAGIWRHISILYQIKEDKPVACLLTAAATVQASSVAVRLPLPSN